MVATATAVALLAETDLNSTVSLFQSWGCCETLQATTGSARSVLNSSILRSKATKFELMYPIRSLAMNVVSSFATDPSYKPLLHQYRSMCSSGLPERDFRVT